ncbi:MAG: asparagine synthetase B [Candidatus Thorarchaeota archaeon]|nr:asparagine synthetase B [Candidatus Thorarchaeota archaeon]
MTGIAGIILFKKVADAEGIVGCMSNAIKHRGVESLHQFGSKDSIPRALISVRTWERDAIDIDSGPDYLHIVDSYPHSTKAIKTESFGNSTTFKTMTIKIDSDRVRLFRSADGICGLYYTQIDSAFIFSSEKKSIWAISRNQIHSLNPGHTLSITWDGKQEMIQSRGLTQPTIDRSIDEPTAIRILMEPLEAIFNRLAAVQKCAVLFSGGVDSALAALLTKKHCKDTLLITASFNDSYDEKAAVRAAELIDSKNIVVKIDQEALWNALPEVIYSIETSERMQVEIALPFFFAARVAKERGVNLLVSGQGPDDLFAGYARHERLMKDLGVAAVEDALWKDVSMTHEMNIQRDVRAIAVHSLDVFFPYMYPPFIKAAMSLPATLKIDLHSTPSRKIIFRELARHLGVPREITIAQKKATQYSSGSTKLLKATILEKLGEVENTSKRDTPSLVQDVLDTIAAHLLMPVARKRGVTQLDLKPTKRLMKRVGLSASSN